jgi:hypothetical protein
MKFPTCFEHMDHHWWNQIFNEFENTVHMQKFVALQTYISHSVQQADIFILLSQMYIAK